MGMDKQTVGVLAVSAVLLGLGAYFAFGLKGSRTGLTTGAVSGSRYTASISNAKQAALALIMYATDYDDRLPPDMHDARHIEYVVDPYLRNRSVWKSLNPNGARFEPNEKLSLVDMKFLVDPAGTPMLVESKEWPDGRRIIGYADGHCMGVTGFDPAVDSEVELTQEGKEDLERQTTASSAAPGGNTLGMPGK